MTLPAGPPPLDEARWLPAIGPYSCFGHRWRIRTTDPHAAEFISDVFADLRSNRPEAHASAAHPDATFYFISPSASSPGIVYRNSECIASVGKLSTTFSALVWGINRWLLHTASARRLLLHAGCVGTSDGIAVVFPAPSEHGKSTLTASLLQDGLHYLSDEAVALHRCDEVEGYSKPLSLDSGSWQLLPHLYQLGTAHQGTYIRTQWHIRASRIASVRRRANLGALIFPEYIPNTGVDLRPVGPSEALKLALRSTFESSSKTAAAGWKVRALASFVEPVPAFRLTFSDLGGARRKILSALEGLNSALT